MDAKAIKQLAADVWGYRGLAQTGAWVSMSCPLAPWTHAHGSDSRESAGISIHDSETSIFHCWGCQRKYPLSSLLREYAELSGEDLSNLIDEVEDEQYLGPLSLPSWDESRRRSLLDDGGEEEILEKAIWFNVYRSAVGHPYLRDRGISDETCERLQLRIDPEDSADRHAGLPGVERILFPIMKPDGTLCGFSGRDTTGTSPLKVRDYSGFRKAKNLLGVHLAAQDPRDYVVLVEGLFDYASGQEAGEPTVAAMHADLTDEQARMLRGLGKRVYLMYDNPEVDKAGARAIDIAGQKLCNYIPVLRTRYPSILIESDDGPRKIKDPGELLAEEMKEMVEGARLF